MSGGNTSSAQIPWRIARFGVFELDAAAGELRKSGMRLKVQDQPFQILLLLLKTPSEIVTRETLQNALWPADTFVEFDHSLNTAVKKLRQALGDDADNPRFVETIPRKGYRFIAPVQFQEERTEASPETPSVSALQTPVPRHPDSFVTLHKHQVIWGAAIGGGLMLAIVAALLYFLPVKKERVKETLEMKPLTWYPGQEITPALSPDGTRVAFAWNKNEENSLHIFVKVIGTEEAVAITSGSSVNAFPVWSPDGRFIAFRRVCVPLVRQVPLVHVSNCGDKTGIYIVPSVGGPERLLLETGPIEDNGQLSYSPDGTRLAFSDSKNGRRTIYELTLSDLSVRQLTSPPTASGDAEPAYSPDGKWLAFSRDTKDAPSIFVMPAGGGTPRQLTYSRDNPIYAGLAWTQDSKNVVYGGIGLWRVSLADGTVEHLSNVVFSFYPSVRGNQVAFADTAWSENIYRLSLGDAHPRPPEPFIVSSRIQQSGQYSPNGKYIAFQSTRAGGFEIFRANADGSNQIQLTHIEGPLTGTPNWSADGKWIVFDSRVKGNADIMAVPPEGGALRYMTTDSSNEAVPSVSRDGKWLYFASDRAGGWNIWKQPFNGGAAVQVTFGGGFGPRESVDGKWLFYTKGVTLGGVWRVPTEGGKEEFVVSTPEGYWGFVVPAERGLYYVGGEGLSPHTLYFYEFSSGKSAKIVELPKPTNAGAPGMGISPDEKSLLITQVESRTSDIVLAEGLR
jgi:Tol biopolymer transport system component/DNA-binding winged helix-turn-helix (wHTH) protein